MLKTIFDKKHSQHAAHIWLRALMFGITHLNEWDIPVLMFAISLWKIGVSHWDEVHP
jgi:hypothetical protein